MNPLNSLLSDYIKRCENFWFSRERTSEKRLMGIQRAKDLAVVVYSLSVTSAASEILKNKQILKRILPTPNIPEIQLLYKNIIELCQNGK